MVVRLVLGILAVTFLPLGAVFVVIGLVVEEPDSGRPEDFVYVGAAIGLAGVVLAIAFAILWQREAARRRRRREGPRATAEIVRALPKPGVRSRDWMAVELTVRFPAAGTRHPDAVRRHRDRLPRGRAHGDRLRPGGPLELRGRRLNRLAIDGELARLGPVLVVDLVDEHLDVLRRHAVGVDERLRDPGDEPALGLEVAR